MSRPQSEAEYKAGLVPPSAAAMSSSRRSVLKGALGAGAALGGAGLLAACGGGSTSGSSSTSSASGGSSGGKTVSFGSNASDAVPKKWMALQMEPWQKQTGNTVKINTIDHNTFQENINTYLQGKPDDSFTWFSGYRMRYFADKGLAGDLSDLWSGGLDSQFAPAFKAASTGTDGKQYLVPYNYYPWAVFYRPSLWKEKGYQVPKTLDELKTLSAKMKSDGLVPIAFADKDGWPAMGTFDVLNMRTNGYQFHVDLCAHKVSWTDPRVKKVFTTWTDLIPLQQADPLGRTWQEAAQALQQKKAGMYLLGLFVSEQFPEGERSDIDFFTFPEIDSAIGADAIDAPVDGYMMAKKPKDEAATKNLLTYLGGPEAQTIILTNAPGNLIPNNKVDTSKYSPLQKKAAEFVSSQKNLSQFFDRDADPTFASTVMIPSLQSFLKDPAQIDSILKSMEEQAKSIYPS